MLSNSFIGSCQSSCPDGERRKPNGPFDSCLPSCSHTYLLLLIFPSRAPCTKYKPIMAFCFFLFYFISATLGMSWTWYRTAKCWREHCPEHNESDSFSPRSHSTHKALAAATKPKHSKALRRLTNSPLAYTKMLEGSGCCDSCMSHFVLLLQRH